MKAKKIINSKMLLVLATPAIALPSLIVVACSNSSSSFNTSKDIIEAINNYRDQGKITLVNSVYTYEQIQELLNSNKGHAFIKQLNGINNIINSEYFLAEIADNETRVIKQDLTANQYDLAPKVTEAWVTFKIKIKSKSNSNDQGMTKWLQVRFSDAPVVAPDLPAEPSDPNPKPPASNPNPNPGPVLPPTTQPPLTPPPAASAPDLEKAKYEAREIDRKQAQLKIKKPAGSLRTNQAWSLEELFLINNENLLDNYLEGLDKKADFSYQAVQVSVDPIQTKTIGFRIMVTKGNAKVYTERLIVRLDLQPLSDEQLLEQEVKRINDFDLKPITYETEEEKNNTYSSTGETGIIKRTYIQLGLRTDIFDYKGFNVKSTGTNYEKTFQIEVGLNGKTKQTNVKRIKFLHDTGNTFKNQEWQKEKTRLQGMQFSLKNVNLTYEELADINDKNLLSKLSNWNANEKFNYKVDNILKSTQDNSIQFQIWFRHAQYSHQEWSLNEKILPNVSFKIHFNLVKSYNADNWKPEDDKYITHNAKPIDTGANYLASPGKGSNSIETSSQGPTAPSEGVDKDAKLKTGLIRNQTQLNQVKNTFSIGFGSHGFGYAFGTAWILDYKLEENGAEPTTFYLATNAHVAQNLKVAHDVLTPERYEGEDQPFQNTKVVELRTIRDPQINKIYDNTGSRDQYLVAELPATQVRTVYIGNDYLTTSPSDFNTTNANWANNEEYIDFSVLEVRFNDAKQAKEMTQNYAGTPERQFKYKQESLLNEKVSPKPKNYSVLGFPAVRRDSFWRPTILTTSNSINDKTNDLATLASSKYYNSFEDKTGMFDAALGLSFFGYNYREAYQVNNWYVSSGLIYPLDYGSLGEGSSGSMMMDKDGYTVGIHFAGDFKASTGFTTALYSEGFNYGGRFGKYNLQSYDLIDGNRNGNHPNQKHSYRTNLVKFYGDNYKTNLYPNGVANALKTFN